MTDWVVNHDTALLEAAGVTSTQLSPVPGGTEFKGTVKDGFIATTIGGLAGFILHLRADEVPTSPDIIAPEEIELFRGLVIRTAEEASTDPAYLMAVAYAGTTNLQQLGGPGDAKVGPFQFTAQEWHTAITTGIAKDEDPPLQNKDRFSWRSQPRVAALLAADCVKGLQAPTALGRLPTRLELYFAQLFGPGAEQILKKPLTETCKTAIQGIPTATPYAAELANSDQSIADALDKLRTSLATALVATGLITADPDESSKPVSTGSGSLAKQAFDILVGLRWSNAQACGILANIQAESNFSHTVDTGDGGKAYGLCQWHDLKTGADRVGAFKQHFGKDIRGSTFEEQVQFIDFELNTTHAAAGQKLRGTATPHDASVIVTELYEIPANKEVVAQARAPQADVYFKQFGP